MTHDSSSLSRPPRIPTGSAGVPFASVAHPGARPAARRGMLLALGVCLVCLMALALFTSENVASAAETEAVEVSAGAQPAEAQPFIEWPARSSASSAEETDLDSTMTLGDMTFSYSSSWAVNKKNGFTYFYPATNTMLMVSDPVTLPQALQNPQIELESVLEGMMSSFDTNAACESATLGEPSFSSNGAVTAVTAPIQLRMFNLDYLGLVCAAVSGDTVYCLTATVPTGRAAQYLPVFQTVWDTATIPGMSTGGIGVTGGSSDPAISSGPADPGTPAESDGKSASETNDPKAKKSDVKANLDSTMTLGDMTFSYSSSWVVREGGGATYLYPDGTTNAMMAVGDPVAFSATTQDPQSQLEDLLEGLASGFAADPSCEDSSVGEPTFSTSGTVTIAKAPVRFRLNGRDYAGYVCAAVNGDTAYTFSAIASADQIARYEPVFQAMWNTVAIPGMDVGEEGGASRSSKSTRLDGFAVH